MGSLKRDFASGVLYTSLAKYSGLIVQILITSVLARLLTPNDFGVVAIATVLIQFFNTLSEAGIGPAIIQKKELVSEEIDSIFTFTIILGLFLFGLFFFFAPIIADYYDNSSLISICKWLSILILFSSADTVTNGLLLKQKRFKLIAIRTLIIQVVTGGFSIGLACYGWGMYALVFSAVSSKVLIFFVNYLMNPLKLNFQFGVLSKIKTYALYQFFFNLVNYFSRNFDKMIIGKNIGMDELGYYEKSYRMMMLPLSNVSYVLTPVMHPIFSELQNDWEKLIKNYLKLVTIVATLSFPLTVFLFFNAREIIMIFFGDQWESSVLPFRILSLSAALQVIHSTSSGIYQAINYTKGLFWSSFATALLMIGGFALSSYIWKTIEAVSYSFLITCTLGSVIVYVIMFMKMKQKISLLFHAVKMPFIMGLMGFLIMFIWEYFIQFDNIIISFVTKSVVIFIITILFIYITKYIDLKEIYNSIRKK